MMLHGNDFVILDKEELVHLHRLVFNSIHRSGIDTKKIPEQAQLITNLCELDDKIKHWMSLLTKEDNE